MLNEIMDVIEIALFSPRDPYASLRTIGVFLLLAWIVGRLVARWFEEKPQSKGGGEGKQEPKPQQQKGGGGGKQQQPNPQPKGGGGGAGGYRPGLLEGILAGIGDGIGQTLRGLGSGIGATLQGLGSGLGGMRGSGSGRTRLDGPQAHSSPFQWGGVAAGFGVGLGLGAAGARAAAGWTKQAATSARSTFEGWRAQKRWDAWHSQGAPAYGWNVDDPAAQQAVAQAFDEAGIRYGWQQDPETGAWQVVIHHEDIQAAQEALGAVGLQFEEPGEPLGIDGQPWQPGVNDLPDDETQEADGVPGEAAVWDEETQQWVPVVPTMDEQGISNGWSSDPAMFTPDSWGTFDATGTTGDDGTGAYLALPDFGGGDSFGGSE